MTPKSDVYQLGLVMHELMTYARWRVSDRPSRLVTAPGYSKRMDAVHDAVSECLAASPSKRPSAEALVRLAVRMREDREQLERKHGAVPKSLWKQPPT